ncbi:uncharacterized protein SPPG_00595 [Spizellomyces punctatus DAOM BR117]|uniref:DNA/RNA-binding protein Alba-like domain-containing protein n=1 Tax=Spizellomyces punctatus (strain DAOM BR117) TaxID=645134 RepID=A0A0L0HU70_SPIPD|nr:uncharacterized protein SPPG_00595 [Spizellomyces punctatus DAOM BR117]KND04901.1 hypothetical protein SPPG_00595 [Spizellomyces punctatus DAOM BR117]|eukprot:XP_016612940.1 hypothetical protein SPPG_00595 [Spizellomyces punctatus DAOM BR117]
MEKYRRTAVGEEAEGDTAAENEIRISSHGKIRTYVAQILGLLKEGKHVVIIGKGKTINKAVTVAEIAKRRLDGKVKQDTDICSVEATDVWDPIEEDLDRLLVTRHLPCIKLTLHMVDS